MVWYVVVSFISFVVGCLFSAWISLIAFEKAEQRAEKWMGKEEEKETPYLIAGGIENVEVVRKTEEGHEREKQHQQKT